MHQILIVMGTTMNHKIMNSTLARGLGTDKPSPLTEKLLIANRFWGKEQPFFLKSVCSVCYSGRLTSLQWLVSYPEVSGQGKLDLVGCLQNQDTKLEGVG